MKMSHFASAAATVLVLAVAAPAFAQTGFISGSYGENRDHPHHVNNEVYSINGAFSVPVGGVEFSGEASYKDLGRDALAVGGTTRATSYSVDTQTLVAGSVYMRNDKWAYGVTVSGGDVGDVAAYHANSPTGATLAVDNAQLLEGSVFAEGYFDKWVGRGRVSLGRINYADGVLSLFTHGSTPRATTAYTNQSIEKNVLDVELSGDFFFNDNAKMSLGVIYRDMESDDPVISTGLGVEWRRKDSPLGVTTHVAFSKFGSEATIGVVGSFGAGTLNDRVRKGPAAVYVSPLRQFDNMIIFSTF